MIEEVEFWLCLVAKVFPEGKVIKDLLNGGGRTVQVEAIA